VFATWQAEPGAAVARDPAAGRTWAQAHTRAGRFAFHGLREGRYRLQVQREGFFGGRPVVPTGTRDVRMVLKAAAEVRGVVLGGGGPVGGAFVRAFLGEGPVGGGWLAGARTDAHGAFTLAGLPPDEPFDLGVAHPDYRELRVRGVRATGEPKELVLDAGAGFAGVVVEPDGTPVPNATVHVLSGGRSVKFERADAAGRFEVSGLGEGPFSAEVSWTPIGHVKTGPVAARPGDRDVRFVVERGERISGEVRWKDASDSRAVRIEALGPDGAALAQTWAWPQNRKFEIPGLPKGTYALRVSRAVDGGFRAVAHVPGVESGASDVRIEVPN
jgi:hypothetical protein